MSANDPILLTPGPLTTTLQTKQAQVRDWGSRDRDFIDMTARILRELNDIVHGGDQHVCVPLQGSGTFSVEGALGTLVPRHGHVLVCVNGEYGKRIARICAVIGRKAHVLPGAEDQPTSPQAVDRALAADASITHVALVHCETSTGILNSLDGIADVVARHGRSLFIDAMSSFGALEIDARSLRFDACVAASGKCLESVPGMGFAVLRKEALERCAGNCHSLALDLYDQWQYYRSSRQWRFTPPTTVVAALAEALDQFIAQGGVTGRGARYRDNCETLIAGMEKLGFVSFLARAIQAPIITTWHAPSDPRYNFNSFYDKVRSRGFTLYPGKLTQVETFRVGCIGAIGKREMQQAIEAIGATVKEMGIKNLAPTARSATADG